MKQTLHSGWLSFTDQACSVKMVEYWPPFNASLWSLTPSPSINMQNTSWPISSHLYITVGQIIAIFKTSNLLPATYLL